MSILKEVVIFRGVYVNLPQEFKTVLCSGTAARESGSAQQLGQLANNIRCRLVCYMAATTILNRYVYYHCG
jgi:hypothetical protein